MKMRPAISCILALLLVACASPEDRVAEYLRKASDFYESGDIERASIEVRNAAQIEPKNAGARVLMARMAMDKKAYIAAHENLLIAQDSAPEDLDVHLLLGRLYSLAREQEKLEKQVEIATRLAPEDPRSRLLQAELYSVMGDYVAADRTLSDFSLLEEMDPAALLLAAFVKSKQDGPAAAAEFLGEYRAKLNSLRSVDQQRVWEARLGYLVAAEDLEGYIEQLEFLTDAMPEVELYTEELLRIYVNADRAADAEVAIRDIVRQRSEEVRPKIMLVEFLAVQKGEEAARDALEEFIVESPDAPDLRLALGKIYDSQGDLDRAMAEYEKSIEMAPNADSAFAARNRIVSVLMRRNKPDEANQLIEQIIADRPTDEDALLTRGTFNLASGDFKPVIADARVVIRSNPQSWQAYLLLGNAHQELGQMELAEEAYRKVIEVNPKNAKATVALASVLTNRGEFGDAEDVVSGAINAGQQSLLTLESLVALLLESKDFTRAQEAADRILKLYPESGSGHFQLGLVTEQSGGSVDEALAAYRRSLEKSPDSMAALRAFTTLAVANKRYESALEVLDSFIEYNAGKLEAQLIRSRTYAAAGDMEASKAGLEQLIKERPEYTDAYFDLANRYPEGSKERFTSLEAGVDAAANGSALAFLLGTEYERAGQYDLAAKAYERALTSSGNTDAAANNLAMLLLNHRDDMESYRRALTLATRFADSNAPGRLDTLGWAHYRNKDYVTATRFLERAVAAQGDSPELRYHLGMAYLQTGDRVRAKLELEKAVANTEANYFGRDEAIEAFESLQSA